METKQKQARVWAIVLILTALFGLCPALQAGSLEPSAPPRATMKTLTEVEPRIPIHNDDLPLIISEPNSYYLAENLCFNDPLKHAITIYADNVTIDLMGFELVGPGWDSGLNYGIYMTARNNVQIHNGTIRGFGSHGIYEDNDSDDGSGHRVINMRLVYNGGYGINLMGPGSLVKDCYVVYNQGGGISAGDMSEYRGSSIITGNVVMGNAGNGIYACCGCIITANSVYRHQGNGITAEEGCTINANKVWRNTGNGIQVSSECTVINNKCEKNSLMPMFDGAGIYVTGSGNRIENNHITGSERGLDIETGGNIVTGNMVKDNTDNYDIAPNNQLNILLCEIPETIDWPATVTLAGSLTGIISENGLTVNADNVTVDLAGHALIGPDPNDGTECGILLNKKSNVEVRNGTVRGFGVSGIYGNWTTDIGHRIIRVRAVSNGSSGIRLLGSGNLVMDCTAVGNDGNGIQAEHGSTVSGNTTCNNKSSGIVAGEGSTVTGNTSYNNGAIGIFARQGCSVTANTTYNNGLEGIYADNSLIRGNSSVGNGGANIQDVGGSTPLDNHAP